MSHVPEDRYKPKATGNIRTLWDAMRWQKVYGYYDTENKEFIPSKRLNDNEVLHMFV